MIPGAVSAVLYQAATRRLLPYVSEASRVCMIWSCPLSAQARPDRFSLSRKVLTDRDSLQLTVAHSLAVTLYCSRICRVVAESCCLVQILRLKEDLEKQRQELVEKDALIRSLESDRETLSGELAALKGSALCQSADIERLRRQGEDDFRQAAQTRFRLARENEHLRVSRHPTHGSAPMLPAGIQNRGMRPRKKQTSAHTK